MIQICTLEITMESPFPCVWGNFLFNDGSLFLLAHYELEASDSSIGDNHLSKMKISLSNPKAALCSTTCLLILLFCSLPLIAQGKLSAIDHQRLISYVNNYDSQKLLADPLVKPQLERLLGPQLSHLKENLNVAGPIGVNDNVLTLSGNAPHMGMEENGFLGVNLYNGEVYVCLLTGGRFQLYSKQTKYEYLPSAVREWIVYMGASLRLNGNMPPNVILHAEQ